MTSTIHAAVARPDSLLPLIALLFLPVFALAQSGVSEKEFEMQIARRGARYQNIDERKHQYLALNGRLAEAIAELERMVPRHERTPMDDLILGDMLDPLDPDRAYPYHLSAWRAYPDQPQAMGPMSMHFQRRGELDSALGIYLKLERLGKLSPVQYALVAQPLIHAGQYERALAAWTRSNHEKEQTSIDFAIHGVFGPSNPIVRHDSLLNAVRAGSIDAIGPLLELAIAWDADWWNVGFNQEALAVDVDAISAKFGATSQHGREARLLADAVAARQKGKDALERLLKQNRMILEGGSLPENTTIARRLMIMALEAGLVDEAALERWHRAELLARTRRPEGNKVAVDILRSFAEKAERADELDMIYRTGWYAFGDPQYAFALLARRLWSGDITFAPGNDTLEQAIRQFPRDSRFPGIAYKLAIDRGTVTPRDIARVIEAEYYALLSDRERYSNALDALFGNLGEALGKEKKR